MSGEDGDGSLVGFLLSVLDGISCRWSRACVGRAAFLSNLVCSALDRIALGFRTAEGNAVLRRADFLFGPRFLLAREAQIDELSHRSGSLSLLRSQHRLGSHNGVLVLRRYAART